MIFDISFEVNIAGAMKFIGHYLYDMKTAEFKPSMRARNFFLKFDPPKDNVLEVTGA